MKNFSRSTPQFSQCGLNCLLCPMQIGHYCPGCGGGEGNQPCKIARCSLQHEAVGFCYQCREYPCGNYEHMGDYDSFITHQKYQADFEKAQQMGIDAYLLELQQKAECLAYLLEHYNAGRQKSFFCLAVNHLKLEDVQKIVAWLDEETGTSNLTLKEKAARAMKMIQAVAEEQNILLKLRKKP